MKTEFQFVESPHELGSAEAFRRSRFRLRRLSSGWTVSIHVMPFDMKWLVVVTRKRRQFQKPHPGV